MCSALLGCNKIEDYNNSFYSNLRQRKNIEDHFLPIQHNAGAINNWVWLKYRFIFSRIDICEALG